MSKCVIMQDVIVLPRVSFPVFSAFLCTVLLANIITILTSLGKLGDWVTDKKERLRNSNPRDPSGAYILPYSHEKLLRYDFPKRVRWLVICLIWSLLGLTIYAVVEFAVVAHINVAPCIPILATYVGLLPLVAVLLAIEFLYVSARLLAGE
jgi:hypothetical protein